MTSALKNVFINKLMLSLINIIAYTIAQLNQTSWCKTKHMHEIKLRHYISRS